MSMKYRVLNEHLISSENQMEGECREHSTELTRLCQEYSRDLIYATEHIF